MFSFWNYLETVSGQRDPQVHTFTNVDRNGREFTVFLLIMSQSGRKTVQVTVIEGLSPAIQLQGIVTKQDQMYRDMIMQSGQGILYTEILNLWWLTNLGWTYKVASR